MTENELSKIIIGIAMEVHTALGPGLLENVNKECLYYKIKEYGFKVEKEKAIPITFEEVKFEIGYRIDLLVEDKLVLELKSVEDISNLHIAQTLTYLKLGNYKLGFLLNFNSILLKNGIKRIVNNL